MRKAGMIALSPLLVLYAGGPPPEASPDPASSESRTTEIGFVVDARAEGETAWTPLVAAYDADDAGCDINFRATNSGRKTITLYHHYGGSGKDRSQVRTRLGTWGPLVLGSVDPGKTYRWVSNLLFACNSLRRYRFRLEKGVGDRHTYYYPSSTTFTRSTTIDLGDVNRFF